ncbi:uncharacterized protein TM35_000035220 [Trypanosoma theileri]|uniref:Uncharacterized protein n=1 Tax=Trypanosoma theileri TaxID=67003 RepID=A0A1X0P857_9TRYP|nr:uncharacterized protein TM35_000035220 [Trypanosoma theileri]ORC92769.1 hypothetical protein TM35_000035220 [Trypanosoma theileri]
MLSYEERSSLLGVVLRQKVVLDFVQTVMRRGVTTKGGTQLRCSNSSLLQWEKEREYTHLCNSIASDSSMCAEEKYEKIVAAVNHIRGSNSMTFSNFLPLTPAFVLAVSLAKLQYGEVSVEFQMASLELVLSYIARGAYSRAGKIMKSLAQGEVLVDSQVGTFYGDLTAFLRLLKSRDFSSFISTEERRFLPLVFCTGEKHYSLKKITRYLEECKLQKLPVTIMLYCYFSAITASFHLLEYLTDECVTCDIGEEVLKKSLLATTLRELSALKEDARERILKKTSLNSKKEEVESFIGVCLKDCEEFIRSNKCGDYGALLSFAFVKIRWEKECGLLPLKKFLENFLICCRNLQIEDTVFFSIFIADADFFLKGKNVPLFSHTCDISAVELPLVRSDTGSSCSLFEEVEGKVIVSPEKD